MLKKCLTICNVWIFLTLILLSMSCGARRVETLNTRLNAYWEGVRWNSPGALSMMVPEEKRNDYLTRMTKKLDGQRVVDFSIVSLKVDKAQTSATAFISYSYYNLNANDLISAQEVQQWEYSKADGNWLITKDSIMNDKNPTAPAKK